MAAAHGSQALGFLLRVARPHHLLPGAPSQFGTRVCRGRLATRLNMHTAPSSVVFFLKNISHLCFESTHGLPEFSVSPDIQKVRNWILCSWTPPLEDDSRAAVLPREGCTVDNAGSVGGFCFGLISSPGEVTQDTGGSPSHTRVPCMLLGLPPIPGSRSCYTCSR